MNLNHYYNIFNGNKNSCNFYANIEYTRIHDLQLLFKHTSNKILILSNLILFPKFEENILLGCTKCNFYIQQLNKNSFLTCPSIYKVSSETTWILEHGVTSVWRSNRG